MESREDRVRSSFSGTMLLSLLTFLAITGVLVFLIPLWACPLCEGRGTLSARDTSNPNWTKLPKSFVDVPCWDCGGKRSITPYRRWTWVPSSLSDR
jgi:hypothetical protein